MRLLLVAGLSLTSLTAFASNKDTFNCKLNLKRGIQTQAFQLKQSLTIERKIIPYPSGEGKNRILSFRDSFELMARSCKSTKTRLCSRFSAGGTEGMREPLSLSLI